jgi:hypothetical protein
VLLRNPKVLICQKTMPEMVLYTTQLALRPTPSRLP